MKNLTISCFILMLFSTITAHDSTQTFLSLRNTGVESFQNRFPEYDGRGTIILVLDTGVDMGVEGLIKTSTGETKVIDIQDFTGQGDIKYFPAEFEEDDDTHHFVNEEKKFEVRFNGKLRPESTKGEYYIGALKESLWKNSGSNAGDINGNGSKDDSFYFIVFDAGTGEESDWVVLLDTDADGDLSDEKLLRDYKIQFDSFILPNKKGLPKFTLGLNILPEEKIVSFVFDDGSHGTHCAGIAAGNRIGDNDLFGVAPGAKLIGLKLGNNNYSGGATVAESMKKSYLYADKLAKEIDEPCIINMSYGIGSEIEGYSEIELFLDKLTENNPYLYIATSNGNLGPGISTSGMPSSSNAVFSSGAVLAEEVGNDLYGTILRRDIILHFSSRGGEVFKPDVVAPGACISTVPNFSKNDRFWGTSMASPYSAGVMSVLLGAAKVEYPEIMIPSKLLYRAIKESAEPMEEYQYLDQGGGLINIEKAYILLKKYIEENELEKFETYTIKSFVPAMPEYSFPSLYIRDGSFLTGNESFNFTVKRRNFKQTNKFYRIYNLKSSDEWLRVVQNKVHIRNNQTAVIKTKIDASILDSPGLYNAKIEATRADKSNIREFDLMATIVIPYEFNTDNKYSLLFENDSLNPGMHKRYFLKIPSNASHLKIRLNSHRNNYTSIIYYLHDPDGEEQLFGNFSATCDADDQTEFVGKLNPGVYEFVVLGQYTSTDKSIYDIEFEIDGINLLGHSIINDKITVANYLSEVKQYEIDGEIVGYRKLHEVGPFNQQTYEIPFVLNKNERKKTFKISLNKTVFNKMTDFALMILNESGKAVKTAALAYSEDSISVSKDGQKGDERFKLVLVPGFADKPSPISFHITETTLISHPAKMSAGFRGTNKLTMYPDVNYTLNFDYKLPDIKLEKNENFIAEVSFKSIKSDLIELKRTIPIKK